MFTTSLEPNQQKDLDEIQFVNSKILLDQMQAKFLSHEIILF